MVSCVSNQTEIMRKDLFAGIVNSLYFHNDFILLAGHGPYLKIFDVRTNSLLFSEELLPNNRIHRIVPAPFVQREGEKEVRRMIIYGSKELRILRLEVASTKISVTTELIMGPLKDWIMDAQWIEKKEDASSKPTSIALAFAHNFVEIYDIQPSVPVLISTAQCEVRCILYSARFTGTTLETLILASGTVFNEVHLWKPVIKNKEGDSIVFKKLVGHEGVIFGMRFNETATQLVSVSDDRTIRVWPLSATIGKPLILFGHTARVWDCQFVDDYLVSISEDASCRVWSNSLNSGVVDEEDAECIACWEGHASKNVWSCAINADKNIVATGGQDSGIRLWSLTAIKNNKIATEDELTTFPLLNNRPNDTIRNFVIIKTQCIIAVTAEGYFIKTDLRAKSIQWEEFYYEASFKNYAIVKSDDNGRIVIAGNIHGELLIFSPLNEFKPVKIAAHTQKIFDIFIEPCATENTFNIISNGYNDSVLVHTLDLSIGHKPVLHTAFNLEMPLERTNIISIGYLPTQNVLICGSRESALIVYHLPASCAKDTIEDVKPSLQLRRSHGRQAITSVLIKDKHSMEKNIIFWTTGRDGCYIQYRLEMLTSCVKTDKKSVETELGIASRGDTITKSEDMILEKLYRNRITKGSLEGSVLVEGELVLLGFFRKNFFVFNESKNFNMMSINCGGGHRRWGFSAEDAKLNKSGFAFIRKEALFAYLRDTSDHNNQFGDSILQNNYHGREVRAIRLIPMSHRGSGDTSIVFATGGEDTILRLQQYLPGSPSTYHTLLTIRKHTTVIKNIDYSQGISTLLFTSGGLEELRCWKLETSSPNTSDGAISVNCLELATCPRLSEDIETRIMDTTVLVYDALKGLHIIGAVYSDGVIRFWLFDESTRQFSLLVESQWHTKCILQISHIILGHRILFFTSATDGRVAIWDIDNELALAIKQQKPKMVQEPIQYYYCHMSGVNALEVILYRGDNQLLIFTGGDDNAISATQITLKDDTVMIGKPFIIPSAHASSVTGIKYMDNSLFTISTDQRLNRWKLKEANNNDLALVLSNSVYMDVPDPSSIDAVISKNKVIVAITGVGLQSVQYDRNT